MNSRRRIGVNPLEQSSSSTSAMNKLNDKRHFLKSTPAPRYAFADVSFGLGITLVDKRDVAKAEWVLPLQIEALYENGQAVPDQSLVEVSPDTKPQSQGTTSILVKFRAAAVDGKLYRLRLSSTGPDVEPVLVGPISVVRYKLKIIDQPPSVWYKDEGGRDKCMTLTAQLVDQTDTICTNREVPLKVTLVYEGDTEVKQQNIFKVLNEGVAKLGRDGKCVVRCRIDEVSKNHQKQSFCIKLAPDVQHQSSCSDIASVVSSPVTVRSKRNKKRKPETPVVSLPNLAPPLRKPPVHASHPTLTTHPMPLQPLHVEPPAQLIQGGLHSDLHPVPTFTSTSAPQTGNTKIEPLDAKELETLANTTHPIGQAVNNVVTWTQHAIREISLLEWQQVGYEVSDSQGQVINFSKPLFRCPSCWVYKDLARPTSHNPTCNFRRLAFMYENSVRNSLQSLTRFATGNNPPSTTSSSIATASAAPANGLNSRLRRMPSLTGNLDRLVSVATQMGTNSSSSSSAVAPMQIDSFPPLEHLHPLELEDPKPSLFPITRSDSDAQFNMLHFPNDSDSMFPPLSMQTSITAPSAGFFDPNFVDPLLPENTVYTVLAAWSHRGYPAFNTADELVGFYRPDDTNALSFVPVDEKVGEAQRKEMVAQLKSAKDSKSSAVVDKHNTVTLENLKETVMLQHYELQAKNFMPTAS